MITNRESNSGVIYKGVWWLNSCKNTDEWLAPIYDVPFIDNKKEPKTPIVTLLVKDGKRVI